MATAGEPLKGRQPDLKKAALAFVILLGVVSLFADMTYEGARSITGPYLQILGASAAVVGFVAGLGELIGYGFRLVSGYISDRTRQYWFITILGYAINMLAVPLLALSGNWPVAALLIVAERFGKAVRSPAKDTILSHPAGQIGRGWGFGLHEALDQIGAVSGPLIVAGVLFYNGSYRGSFAFLLVPAVLALIVLLLARARYPDPGHFEPVTPKMATKGIPRVYWVYLAAIGLVAAAYADFALIAFHFQEASIVPAAEIPVFYAIAMAIDALAALFFGRLYDRYGIVVLAGVTMISACFPLLVFTGNTWMLALSGMIVWGIGLGTQESIMRAAVADLSPSDKRATAYGIFNTGYGIFWFLGSALMGILYEVNIMFVVLFSVALQLAAVAVFMRISRS